MALTHHQQKARDKATEHLQDFINSGETDTTHLKKARGVMKSAKLSLNKTASPEVLQKVKPYWDKLQ